jgi:hypothetical protein
MKRCWVKGKRRVERREGRKKRKETMWEVNKYRTWDGGTR